MRQGYPSNHTYLIFAMMDIFQIMDAMEDVAVCQIMGNIYIYFRAGVALTIIFMAVNPDDSFGLVAFLNDHNTWSGLHGYVEEIRSESGIAFDHFAFPLSWRECTASKSSKSSYIEAGPEWIAGALCWRRSSRAPGETCPLPQAGNF